MPCCDKHDRLDQVLHAEEYLSMKCGDLKYVTTQTAQPGGGSPAHHIQTTVGEDGVVVPVTKPGYCCVDCPTLIAAHKAG
jgi:hypothetical protein